MCQPAYCRLPLLVSRLFSYCAMLCVPHRNYPATMMDCQSIGARVRHHRKQNGLSQEELAERTETSRVYISNIERGEAAPSLEVLLSIANTLSISADDLLAGNLLSANTNSTEEEMDILFDCSQEESRILLESMKAIKMVLRGYNITK